MDFMGSSFDIVVGVYSIIDYFFSNIAFNWSKCARSFVYQQEAFVITRCYT
jgi:hypothetical protein